MLGEGGRASITGALSSIIKIGKVVECHAYEFSWIWLLQFSDL